MRKTNQSLLQHISSRFRSTTCAPTNQVKHHLQLYSALKSEHRCGQIDDEEFAKSSLRLIEKLRTDSQVAQFISQYMNVLNQN